MEWPILVDSLNLLGVEAVPITLFLDEKGIVKAINPQRASLKTFLTTPTDASEVQEWVAPSANELLTSQSGGRLVAGTQKFLWGGEIGLSEAVTDFERLVRDEPQDAVAHFRLGVSYRARYDSPSRESSDFAQAVRHWGAALGLNPNQYIWRRRIQQYGPRLDKPYSFYDWVRQARSELADRGLPPAPLVVEPGGAEFAYPVAEFEQEKATEKNPDPEGRIYRDVDRLITLEAVAVPDRIKAGESVRIHLTLRPDSKRRVHWNNEVDDLLVWVEAGEGWLLDGNSYRIEVPEEPETTEERHLEFEAQLATVRERETQEISGYVLYYVCEDVNGQCLYRRQDFSVPVQRVK